MLPDRKRGWQEERRKEETLFAITSWPNNHSDAGTFPSLQPHAPMCVVSCYMLLAVSSLMSACRFHSHHPVNHLHLFSHHTLTISRKKEEIHVRCPSSSFSSADKSGWLWSNNGFPFPSTHSFPVYFLFRLSLDFPFSQHIHHYLSLLRKNMFLSPSTFQTRRRHLDFRVCVRLRWVLNQKITLLMAFDERDKGNLEAEGKVNRFSLSVSSLFRWLNLFSSNNSAYKIPRDIVVWVSHRANRRTESIHKLEGKTKLHEYKAWEKEFSHLILSCFFVRTQFRCRRIIFTEKTFSAWSFSSFPCV